MENNENKENNPEIKDCYSEAKLLNLMNDIELKYIFRTNEIAL